MARSKTKSANVQSQGGSASTNAAKSSSAGRIETVYKFPFLQYASVAGTCAVLVSFCAVALPSSAKWLGFRPLPQLSSVDRPQPAYLNPITANPAGTVLSVSLGIFAVMGWWAGWVRQWWADEKRLKRFESSTERAQEKIFVRFISLR